MQTHQFTTLFKNSLSDKVFIDRNVLNISRVSLDSFSNSNYLLGPDANPYGVKFTDHKVCKSFLYGCCPHEILASTVSQFSFAKRDIEVTFYDLTLKSFFF